MTATIQNDGKTNDVVAGFCEIAMLSNPILCHDHTEDCVISTSNSIGDADTNSYNNNQYYYYSPAITNLAVSPKHRRRGIARRLLARAERYVKTQWGAESLGLYVEKTNTAALTLYQNCGFVPTITCCSGDGNRLGEMWYMRKMLVVDKQQKEHGQEGECSVS